VSKFASVDDSPDPAALVAFLDFTARTASGMKQYAVAVHALRRPSGPILDVGCGAGHDLALFAGAGMRVVGVDPSAVMVATARGRVAHADASVVRAAGEALPFASEVFAGCRIERVLIHVDDPYLVADEVLRCVASGGLVSVYEPNWVGLRVRSQVLAERAAWLGSVKHPDLGARLWDLLDDLGCDVLDRVEELSVWRSLATLELVAGLPASLDRAVEAGRVDRGDADRWITEQRQRDAAGEFYALMPKVQVIATKR